VSARPTIYQVARRSGVSTATVSRVMHDSPGFSIPTRDRVLAAAADLGWVPSGPARGLASRRAGIVGVLFPDLGESGDAEEESSLFVDEVIRGAERAATAVGDALLIAATRGASGRKLAYSVAGKVDGLVVMARSLAERDVQAIARSVPVVVFANRPVRGNIDSIGADNRGGMKDIVGHLVQVHACSDLVFVGGPARSPDSVERFAGFRDALRDAGLPDRKSPDVEGGFTEAGGARAVRALLADRPPPHAVVCGNDEMAIGALAVLRAAKFRVPSQVAVTGFDDIALAHHLRSPLTTVHQPMRDLGEQAVRMLLDRVNDPTAPRRSEVLPTQLVVRGSCGCRRRPKADRVRAAA
jgi:LacI family transcriptional regulator